MLSAGVKTEDYESYCIVNTFDTIDVGGHQLINEFDCPLLELTEKFEVVPSVDVLKSVSVIHACSGTCISTPKKRTLLEREEVEVKTLKTIKHDYTNNMFFLNLYCINYY